MLLFYVASVWGPAHRGPGGFLFGPGDRSPVGGGRIPERFRRTFGRGTALRYGPDGSGLRGAWFSRIAHAFREGLLPPLSASCVWPLAPGLLHSPGGVDTALSGVQGVSAGADGTHHGGDGGGAPYDCGGGAVPSRRILRRHS